MRKLKEKFGTTAEVVVQKTDRISCSSILYTYQKYQYGVLSDVNFFLPI